MSELYNIVPFRVKNLILEWYGLNVVLFNGIYLYDYNFSKCKNIKLIHLEL